MGGLTGKGGASQAATNTRAAGLQIQTSVLGAAVPLIYGATRVAGNVIWAGDFKAIAHQSSAGGGGKGGVVGGGGKGGGGGVTYTYQTGLAIALGEGPIAGVNTVYVDKNVDTPAQLGFTVFDGTYPQAPWGVLATNHPDQALPYTGIAYVAADPYNLGSTPTLPNHNYEVYGRLYATAANGVDAEPSQVITDLLTNADYGAGFPAARLGDLSLYKTYCQAVGLWVSPAYVSQTSASQMLDELAKNTNSAFVWSSGVLTLVPFGDTAVTGNGATYQPAAAPQYDLTDDDFLPNANAAGSSGTNSDPVLVTRKRPADAINNIKIEFLNRSNQYNPEVVEAIDQAAVDRYGRRTDGSRSSHMFADPAAAKLSVQLQLQRETIKNVYQFTLGQRFIRLDPMDIVTLTDNALGLNKQWVRITEITEQDDGTLLVTAEEYQQGTGHAALYNFGTSQGYKANADAAPPSTNAPVMFAAPVQLAQSASGLELWVALSGPAATGAQAQWGGCDVWVSSDGGNSYPKQLPRVLGGSRQGVISQALPSGSDPDLAHALMVDLTMTNGGAQLLSGTQADADAFHTLCYVDGELISYETATLIATGKYALTYLRRGAYGTAVKPHLAGKQFARLDESILIIPYTADQIGKTLNIKFPAFNIFGGGLQSLSQVPAYSIVLPAPPVPPDVTNFAVANSGEVVALTWTQVADNAILGYDIRYGAFGVTDWNQMMPLTEAKKGTEMTNAAVPPGLWTFAIRALSIDGKTWSTHMATQTLQVVTTNPVLATQPQAPVWGNLGVV